MRVLHLIAPSPMGGAERVAKDLTGELAKQKGIDVHLCAILGEADQEHPFLQGLSPDVRIHRAQLPARAYWGEWQWVGNLIRTIGPDVAHTHGYRADVVSGLAARHGGVPVVCTAHGFTGGGLRNRLYEWLQVRAFARADAVIAVSGPMHAELTRRGVPPDRIHTIVNARRLPDHILDAEAARAELGVPDHSFHVGWVGRMSPEKGPDVMVEALVQLLTSRPDESSRLHATMIGEGRLRSTLEARVSSAGLADRIHFTGVLPDAVRYYRALDALVLTSRTEGTPLVALEAMELGIPLVASRVGGLPSLLGSRGGLLLPPDDPRAVADALCSLQADPDAAERRADVARQRLQRNGSPQAWAARHIALYDEVMS